MANKLVKYIHRTEKRPDIEAILLSWVFNLVTAFLVFNATWSLTGNVFVTVVYTLAGWTITLSMSVAFWLSWIFNRLKTQDRTKTAIAGIVLFMYVIGMYVLWTAFMYVFGLFF
ncbi:MAG: hypothetical protein JXC85_02325 [Candidatus Aenigmarchaeota archaeon]|nr:hypothetical protein [Candidatus Aenigmarchaeota archaeon]